MKNILIALSVFISAYSVHASSIPRYGEFNELPGYVLSCPTERGDYHYWFAMRGPGTAVAISRIGYPNGNQLFARVIDGERTSGGFNLILRNEQGAQVYVSFKQKSGFIDVGKGKIGCSVSKTVFVI